MFEKAQKKIAFVFFFLALILGSPSLHGHDGAFKKGMVSLTFDDGYLSDYEVVMPLLKNYGMKATFYVCPGLLDQSNRLKTSHLKKLRKNGHEIGSHTYSHHHLTHLTPFQLRKELIKSKKKLEEILGEPVIHMAVPYGNYDDRVLTTIKKIYRSNRSVRVGFNFKNAIKPYELRVKNINRKTTLAEVEYWLDKAERYKVWLIIVYHQVGEQGDEWCISPKALQDHLKAIQKRSLEIATIGQALKK